MKKYVGYLPIIVFLIAFLFYCQPTPEKVELEKTRIILINPNLWYLKSFIYLVENKIIDIPNLELIAVVYARANHDFKNIKKFLRKNDYSYIHLQKIGGGLNQNNLFQKNSCSEHFYKIFKESDGILFLGGGDLQPSAYEQKTSLLTDIKDPYRHYFELSFLFHLLGGSQDEDFQPYLEEDPDYVVFGFCLGLQTMNVATGGSLYQDVPHEIYGLQYVEDVLNLEEDLQHRNYWRDLFSDDDLSGYNFYRIKLVKDQFFTEELKASPDEHSFVLSMHHQAIRDLGKGLEATATSLDGKVIEAIAHSKFKNVIGVQFHPELYHLYSPEEKKYKRTLDDAELLSDYDILKSKQSLNFHQKFWAHFNRLFDPIFVQNNKAHSK
jgi:putative glutamine amidotransferase